MQHTNSAKQILEQLNSAIEDQKYGTSPTELYQPLAYIMALGGKRIRPVLACIAYQLYKTLDAKFIEASLAIELFHNFSLIHDDIMDMAPLRRGLPTVHQKWNNNTAILAGDVMLVKAYQQLLHLPDSKLSLALSKFNTIAAQVCEGQQFDMNFEVLHKVTTADYIEMIRLKTAVLLGFSCWLGGYAGGANPADCDHLYSFGENLGLAFQLTDDSLDVYGNPATFGKQVGGDILANKKTWLLITCQDLIKNTDLGVELDFWLSQKLSDDASQNQKKIDAITSIYNKLGINNLINTIIDQYYAAAKSNLDALARFSNDKNGHSDLWEIAESLMVRHA